MCDRHIWFHVESTTYSNFDLLQNKLNPGLEEMWKLEKVLCHSATFSKLNCLNYFTEIFLAGYSFSEKLWATSIRYNSQHALSFGSAVQTCKFKKKIKIKQYIYKIIFSLLLIWNRCFSWTLTAQPAQIWKFVSIAESFYSVRYGSSNIMSFIPLNNLFCFMSFKMFFEQSAIFTRVERPCY